jgi:copper chaperone
VTTTTYQVTGMTCEHCVRAVTSELSALPGVQAVSIDLRPDHASQVTVTSAQALDRAGLTAALDEAGGYQLVM